MCSSGPRGAKGKCRVLQLGRDSHVHQYWLGADLLGMSSVEKDLRVLVDNRLAMASSVPLWPRRPMGQYFILFFLARYLALERTYSVPKQGRASAG